jgi:hypothetical protein
MPDSLISSVGRGYSDLCAALCAVALEAQELQIWKEVDGIFTADPRKIKAARLLATVTSEEASELTYYGSEVSLFQTNLQLMRVLLSISGNPPSYDRANRYCWHSSTTEERHEPSRIRNDHLPIEIFTSFLRN